MSASDIKAGSAFVQIRADKSLYDKAVIAVQASMKRLSFAASKIGTSFSSGFTASGRAVRAMSGHLMTASGLMGGLVLQSSRRLAASASTIGRSFSSGFGAANSALKTMAGGLMSTRSLLAGFAGAAGVGVISKQFADAGSALDDMSQRTGVAADELSALGYAAQMSGTDIDAVEKAIRKMQQTGKVLPQPIPAAPPLPQPGQPPARTPRAPVAPPPPAAPPAPGQPALPATPAAVPSATMASLMAYADQIAAIEDPAKQTAMAIEIFGKSGAAMLPMLKLGSAGLQKLATEAAGMGAIMSDEDVAIAAELGDGLDKISIAIAALRNRIGAALGPSLIKLSNLMVDVIGHASTFIANNQALLVSLAKWAAIGGVVLGGIAAVGAAGLALSGVMGGLAAIGGAVATVFTLIGGAIAFVLSPLGLVLAGVIGAAGAFVYFSGVGSTALNYITEKFGQLREWIMPIIDGVTTALMSGQWAAAGKIAMLALEQAIRVGTQPIYNLWTDVYSFLATTTVSLMATIANTFASGWTSVVNGFATATTWLTNIFASIPGTLMQGFNTAITWLTGAWDSTVSYIAKKLLYLYSLFDKSVDYEAAAKQMDVDAAKRADERQKQLDAANNKLQTETDKANVDRLKSLDEATRKREQALADANARRSELATGMVQGIRDQANERKSEFDQRIQEIGSEIKTTLEEVNRKAAEQQTARDAAKEDKPPEPTKPELTMPQMQTAMGEAQKTVGTFSGFGAGLVGGGGVNNSLRSMVSLQTSANKKLDKIADNTAMDDESAMEYGS
jgi:hypothetical protein